MTWRIASLETLAAPFKGSITDGPFGSNLARQHYRDSGPLVVRLQNIGDGTFVDSPAHIDSDHFDTLRKHEVLPGDLLVASLGEVLPRACLAPSNLGPAIVKADCIRVRLREDVEPRWVNYALQRPSVRKWAGQHRHGVGRPRLGLKGIRQIPIPIPQIKEQTRIVEMLEDHLSHLDAVTRYISPVHRRLEALLARTVSDSLRGGGGETLRVDDVSVSVKNGIFVSRPGTEPCGVPILRIGAVRPLRLSLDDLRYSERDVDDLAARGELLESGDLVFTRYNGNPRFVGSCAVVGALSHPLTYPDKLIRVRVDPTRALPGFVALACTYGPGRTQIEAKLKTSAGQVGISGRELRTVEFGVPDLATQAAVVDKVSALMAASSRLDRQRVDIESRADVLRRAVLTAAFEGKLTGRKSDDDVIEELADDERMIDLAGSVHPNEETSS